MKAENYPKLDLMPFLRGSFACSVAAQLIHLAITMAETLPTLTTVVYYF
jgi:hypothetical protein